MQPFPFPISTTSTSGATSSTATSSVAIPSLMGGNRLNHSPTTMFPPSLPLSSSLHSTSAAIPMPHGSSHLLGTSATSSSFLSGSIPQSSQQQQEEITTIFVVGFPDDMSEREFQSMFTFSPGFEAAALKIPQPGEMDDPLSKKQIIGFAKFRTRGEALDAVQVLAGRKVDAERGCVLKAEMAKKNLHTKKTSTAVHNGSVTSNSTIGFSASNNPTFHPSTSAPEYHSQYLKSGGMATTSGNANPLFRRSRPPMNDLMQYVDPALFNQGRDDSFSGGLPGNNASTSNLHQQQQQQQGNAIGAGGLGSSYASTASHLDYYYQDMGRHQSIDLGSVVPGTAASAAEESSTPGFRMSSDEGSIASPLSVNAATPTSNSAATLSNSDTLGATSVSDETKLQSLMNYKAIEMPAATIAAGSQPVPILPGAANGAHHQKNSMTPPEAIRTAFSLESDPYFLSSAKSPLSANSFLQSSHGLFSSSERGFNSALFNSESLLSSSTRASGSSVPSMNGPLSTSMGAGGLVSAASSNLSSSFSGTSPSLSHQPSLAPNSSAVPISMNSSGNSRAMPSRISPPQGYSGSLDRQSSSFLSGSLPTSLPFTGNDQNPPCNTLYVGNLPPDANEEELRVMFNACPGYKRMSFKNRGNGPMCFVEFESIYFATQALVQLYGNHLSNSTKGGIRLSYSKNPLGVRQQQPSTSQQQQSSATSSPAGAATSASGNASMNGNTAAAYLASSYSSSLIGNYNTVSKNASAKRGASLSDYSALSSSLSEIYPSHHHVQSHHLSLGRSSNASSTPFASMMLPTTSSSTGASASSESLLHHDMYFSSPTGSSLLPPGDSDSQLHRLVQQS